MCEGYGNVTTAPKNESNMNVGQIFKHTHKHEKGREAQTLAGGALFDLEQLAEAQSILVPSESLLVQLELS